MKYPLQYLNEKLSYEVDVLHADKHRSVLQVDTNILMGVVQPYPKYPGKFAMSL